MLGMGSMSEVLFSWVENNIGINVLILMDLILRLLNYWGFGGGLLIWGLLLGWVSNFMDGMVVRKGIKGCI